MKPQRNKLVLIGFGVLALLVIVIFIATLFPTKKGNVEISISPISSFVTINNKEYKVNKTVTVTLPKGTYTLKVRADHFTDREVDIEVKDETTPTRVGILLQPSDDKGKSILLEDSEAEWRDIVGQLEARNSNESLLTNNPLFNYLPHISVQYRVDYAIDTATSKYMVWITADTELAISSAREWIASVDSVGTYDIRTRDYSAIGIIGNTSQSWEPTGRDVSDTDLTNTDTQQFID